MTDLAQALVIDAIELRPKDQDERAWLYVPQRPSLERNPGGTPMLKLVEAGATAFLQCTARVALNEDTRAALLARLKEKKPKAETLEAAPLSVEKVTLEAKTADGWSVLAESKSSGLPPWTAAFAVMLDPAPLAAIKASLAGEKERVRLTARLVLSGSPAYFRSTQSASEARIESPAGSASTHFAANAQASSPVSEGTSHDLTADLSDFFRQGGSHS